MLLFEFIHMKKKVHEAGDIYDCNFTASDEYKMLFALFPPVKEHLLLNGFGQFYSGSLLVIPVQAVQI